MGSFQGHALPGSIFLFFGIWQAVDILYRYLNSLYEPHRKPYSNRPSVRTHRGPIEAYFKIFLTSVGIIGEFVTAIHGGKFTHIHNGQHMTMYGFFLLNGIVDIIMYYKVPAIPAKLDYISAILALAMEAILFIWHLHGRTPMDIQVHTFLTYAIFLGIFGAAMEMLRPGDVRPALIRSAGTIIQGTWFWQVGFILYPKFGAQNWKEDDHTQMLIVTMIFTWHVALVGLFLFFLGLILYKKVKRRNGGQAPPTPSRILPNGSAKGKAYHRLGNNEEKNTSTSVSMFSDDDLEI